MPYTYNCVLAPQKYFSAPKVDPPQKQCLSHHRAVLCPAGRQMETICKLKHLPADLQTPQTSWPYLFSVHKRVPASLGSNVADCSTAWSAHPGEWGYRVERSSGCTHRCLVLWVGRKGGEYTTIWSATSVSLDTNPTISHSAPWLES